MWLVCRDARICLALRNRDWKPFELFDGTPVLVPGDFNVTTEDNGSLLIYPQGDISVPASGRMPKNGHYFDSIIRQEPIDEDKLDPADNLEEFDLLSNEDIQGFINRAEKIAKKTDCGVVITLPGTAIGDIALVPAPFLNMTALHLLKIPVNGYETFLREWRYDDNG